MVFYPFEVTTPHIIYAVLGGFIVLFGMFSLFLRSRLYVGEACWAFICGIIIGPYCANIFDPRSLSHADDAEETANVITLEFTRIVLAIGVFAIGVELPKAYMLKHWRSLLALLVPVMTWGWFVSAGLIYALIPGLNFLSSLAIAACLTPTDPILAAAVVGGKWADKHVPAHIRHLLAAESGCNDGAAFPFLYIALYLIIDKSTGAAIRDWFILLWLYQVLLGCLIGGMLGFGFRHLMKFCQRHDLIDRHSYVAQYVSLAILTIGLTTLLGSDDLLAAFCCGTAFAWDGFFNKQTEESVFSSVIDTLFNVAAFIYVGAWMPFNQFQNAELTLSVWRLLVIAILVLLLRRLPVMVAVYRWMPDIKTFQEAVFAGHFGPIGIGAVFISTLATEILHDAHEGGPHGTADQHRPENAQMKLLSETIQPVVAFMVLCSIAVHGLSIPSFSLGRRVHSVSRTWSRRDSTTITSRRGGRPAQPEWANQARLVSRAEDIVVNRDRPREGELDLERGDLIREKTVSDTSLEDREMDVVDEEGSETTRRNGDTDIEKLAESGLSSSGETRVHIVEPGHDTPVMAGGPSKAETTAGIDQPEEEARHAKSERHPEQQPEEDYVPEREGDVDVSEWVEGHHRIIERRTGPGDDVEVTVLDESPETAKESGGEPKTRWRGRIDRAERDAEGLGHALSKQLSGHVSGHSGGLSSLFSNLKPVTSGGSGRGMDEKKLERRGDTSERSRERGRQEAGTKVMDFAHSSRNTPPTHRVEDSGEDNDEEWLSEAERDEPSEPNTPVTPTASSTKKRHHHPLRHLVHGGVIGARPKRHSSGSGNNAASSSSPNSSPTRATGTTPIISAPVAVRRPPTHQDSTSTTASTSASSIVGQSVGRASSPTRTGTADSTISFSDNVRAPRNQRVETIRVTGAGRHSRNVSRDSSPSRSVRFAQGTNNLSAPAPGPASSPSPGPGHIRPSSPLPPSTIPASTSMDVPSSSPYARSGLPGLSALGAPLSEEHHREGGRGVERDEEAGR